MGRSRRTLDRKALRADNEAAERRKPDDEVEETEEEEEGDEDEDEEEGEAAAPKGGRLIMDWHVPVWHWLAHAALAGIRNG